jgi:hypothetical protein
LAGASRWSYKVAYTTGQWDTKADKLSQEVYATWFEALKDGTITAEALKTNISNIDTQEEFGKDQSEMIAIVDSISATLLEAEMLQDERAAVAETYLSQIASNTTKESDQYDNILDFYSSYTVSDENQKDIQEKIDSLTNADGQLSKADYKGLYNSDNYYAQLMKDYEVGSAGNTNLENMQALYAKMTGQEVSDLGEDYDSMEELAKAIANIDNGK